MAVSAVLDGMYDHIKIEGQKSYAKLALLFKTSKTSIFRKIKQIKSRTEIKGSTFFETEEGQQWLYQFIIICILIFGVICGIGSERISLFFSLICVTSFAGLSASSVGRIEQKIDVALSAYKNQQDNNVLDKAKDIEIVAGADETFFKNIMILVLMDLRSGFIFTEQSTKDRKHKMWEKIAMPWLSKFKNILCLVSDRAKAIIKLAEDSIDVPSIPDLFHLMQDIPKVIGSAISKRISTIEEQFATSKRLGNNIELLTKLNFRKNILLKNLQRYATSFRRLSTSLHPFKILSTEKQDSAKVEKNMTASLDAIDNVKNNLNITDNKNVINKARKQIPEAAQQVDQWWQWVNSSIDGTDFTSEQKDWLINYYLPLIYWQKQLNKTSSKKIKRFYLVSIKRAKQNLANHKLTSTMLNKLDEPTWENWAKQMCDYFQRTSSAVEGRNGWLSQMHFSGRGLSKERIESQTTIHNYFLKREDGTTAYERLTGEKPADLLKFIMDEIGQLPKPRNGEKENDITS